MYALQADRQAQIDQAIRDAVQAQERRIRILLGYCATQIQHRRWAA